MAGASFPDESGTRDLAGGIKSPWEQYWGRVAGGGLTAGRAPASTTPFHLNCILPRLKTAPSVGGHILGKCAGEMRAEVTASFRQRGFSVLPHPCRHQAEERDCRALTLGRQMALGAEAFMPIPAALGLAPRTALPLACSRPVTTPPRLPSHQPPQVKDCDRLANPRCLSV